MAVTVLKTDMHCEKCAERITKAMAKAQIDTSVCLEEKTVTVNGCQHCVGKAKEILEDLGFEVSEA